MKNKKLNSNHAITKDDISAFKIFHYLGSALIFFGIIYFISANWNNLDSFSKIFSTLGSAIVAFMIGILLHSYKKLDSTSSAFFLVSGLVLPIGICVAAEVLNERNILHLQWATYSFLMFATGLCTILFLLVQLSIPKTIFLIFNIVFSSLFFISFIHYFAFQSLMLIPNLVEYEGIILGLSYILFAYYLQLNERYALTGPLYFFGCFFILFNSYFLGSSFFGEDFTNWKIINAIFIFLSFFLAPLCKSKSFLYLGSIFLIIYVTDLSYKFSEVFGRLGWPLILVIVGLSFIFLGFLVLSLQRKITRS